MYHNGWGVTREKTIHKYPLSNVGKNEIIIPEGTFEFLSLEVQHNVPVVYLLITNSIDTGSSFIPIADYYKFEPTKIEILVVPTGAPFSRFFKPTERMPHASQFLGTAMLDQGHTAVHVFSTNYDTMRRF